MCIQLNAKYEYPIYIEYILFANDITVRSHLEYEGTGKVKLPPHIPTSGILADPSHCVKVMSSPIFKLAEGITKNSRKCIKIDALRIKKIFVLYINIETYLWNKWPIEQMHQLIISSIVMHDEIQNDDGIIDCESKRKS